MADVTEDSDRSRLTAELANVFRVAFRLTGNRHEAEDLTQDVCERALRRIAELATRR